MRADQSSDGFEGDLSAGWSTDAIEDDGGGADRRGLAKVLSAPSTAMGSSPATSGFFSLPEKGIQRLFVESLRPSKVMSQNCWISNKMVHCGKIVGISVENCKGG